MTSYDVIHDLKKEYPGQKIGHSGTLDPLATGLLLIGVGPGTKQLHQLQGLPKTYQATIDFSQISDTRDIDYWEKHEKFSVLERGGRIFLDKKGSLVLAPSLDEIQALFDNSLPEIELPLPDFSAKKIAGKKMYEYARKGQTLKRTSLMRIFSYRIISYTFPILEIEFYVGSGTYIRSIAYWLGQKFGVGGILTALRRTEIGIYKLP